MNQAPRTQLLLTIGGGLAIAGLLVAASFGRSPGVVAVGVIAAVVGFIGLLAGARSVWRGAREPRVTRPGELQKRVADLAVAARVVEADRLKDESLSVIVHELRNPLSPILIWTQLLRTGTLDADKTRAALEAIERSVAVQASLIDELLDLSRVSSGALQLDLRPIDLGPLVQQAAEAQRPVAAAKRIRLQIVADSGAGLVSGDAVRIGQAVNSLIANALAATPEGGVVRIHVQQSATEVEVAVSDRAAISGMNLVAEPFDPYRRDADGGSQRSGRLALGLAIARQIVERHGGAISSLHAASEPGSSLRLRLPMLTPPVIPGVPLPATGARRSGTLERLDGLHVLVVDDDPLATEALRMLFHSCGARVQVALNARDALLALARGRVDVLVSDIVMPEQDGVYLVRELRRLGPLGRGDVPALALTGFSSLHDSASVLAAGFQMCFEKPSDPSRLVAAVAHLAARG